MNNIIVIGFFILFIVVIGIIIKIKNYYFDKFFDNTPVSLLDRIKLFGEVQHKNSLLNNYIRFFNKERMGFINYEIRSIQKIYFSFIYSYEITLQNSDIKYKILKNSSYSVLISDLFKEALKELGSPFLYVEPLNFDRLNDICNKIQVNLRTKKIEKEIKPEDINNILVL
jgi:hypothetical protein